jgi:ArsR family transcriptional regulator
MHPDFWMDWCSDASRPELPVPTRSLPVQDRLPPCPEVGPVAGLLRVLADERRLAILALLAQGELCVCHLVDILALPQSTVSRHVGLLKRAGLVRDRRDERDARWVYYRLDPAAFAALHARLTAVLGLTGRSAEAAERPAPPCPP